MEQKHNEIQIEEYDSLTSKKEEFKFKIVVVGDSGVGKTNLINRFVSNTFRQDTKATVGVEFMSKTFLINGEVFRLEVWDTAGQERYKAITAAYYKGANGALVVYDVTRETTFQNVDKWLKELKDKSNEKVSLMLIGNKIDLIDDIKVKSEESFAKAKMLELPIMETSALNASNVEKAFYTLLKEIYLGFIERKKNINANKEGRNAIDGINLNLNHKKDNSCC